MSIKQMSSIGPLEFDAIRVDILDVTDDVVTFQVVQLWRGEVVYQYAPMKSEEGDQLTINPKDILLDNPKRATISFHTKSN